MNGGMISTFGLLTFLMAFGVASKVVRGRFTLREAILLQTTFWGGMLLMAWGAIVQAARSFAP